MSYNRKGTSLHLHIRTNRGLFETEGNHDIFYLYLQKFLPTTSIWNPNHLQCSQFFIQDMVDQIGNDLILQLTIQKWSHHWKGISTNSCILLTIYNIFHWLEQMKNPTHFLLRQTIRLYTHTEDNLHTPCRDTTKTIYFYKTLHPLGGEVAPNGTPALCHTLSRLLKS